MKIPKLLCYGSIGLMALGLCQLRADEWNQKTIVKFSGPVEVPGQVLPAGTYVFKLLDSQSDRNIVEVFNKNQTHLLGTFMTVADYHLRPRGKTIISFEERAAGAPEAVKAWFYPGDNFGHEFVYPKVRAVQLAQANNQPVPSMPTEMAKNTTESDQNKNAANVEAMKQAPLKAQKPDQQEVDIYEVYPPQNQSSANNNNQAPPANQQAYNNPPANPTPRTLPRTGSEIPLLGLLGLASLAGAGVVRYAAVRIR